MPAEARQSLILIAGTGTATVLGLGYALYVGRTLGPAASADFFVALFLVSFFARGFGPINPTVTRFVSVYEAKGEGDRIGSLADRLTLRIAVIGSLGLVIGIATLPAVTRLLQFRSELVLGIAYAVAFATVLTQVPRGVLRGVQNFSGYNLNTIAESSLRLIVGVGLLLVIPSVTVALCAYLIALGGALALGHFQLRGFRRAGSGPPIPLSKVGAFAIPMFVMSLAAGMFQCLDLLYVKYRFSAADAGLYGAAAAFARGFALLFLPFRILLLPIVSSLHARNQPMDGALARVSGSFLALSGVPLLAVWLWSGPLVRWTVGESFLGASPLLLPMALSMMVGLLPVLVGQTFAAADHWRWLGIYLACLGGEFLALAFWAETPGQAVGIALVAKGIAAAAIGTYFVLWRLSARRAWTGLEPSSIAGAPE